MSEPIIQRRHHLWRLLPESAWVAEIGVAEGRFSLEMLDWPIRIERLVLVDAWATLRGTGDGNFPQEWHDANYKSCLAKMEPYKDRVTILRGLSYRVAKELPVRSLDMVYLDAGHSYEAVTADLRAWWPKLKGNGIMAGHDYLAQEYGVHRAVNEFANNIRTIPENGADAGFWFRKEDAK